jgi:hypothetical protein
MIDIHALNIGRCPVRSPVDRLAAGKGVIVCQPRRLLILIVLEYTDHTLIGFDDTSYRWISVKRFNFDRSASDEEALGAHIAHWRYRDNFLSPHSHEQDTKTIHGPYRVAEIVLSSFERIEPGVAAAVVEEFCELYDCPPRPEVRERIRTAVMASLPKSVCYRLRELPHATHEYSFVLWEFRELAVLDRSAGVVLSVVMAID